MKMPTTLERLEELINTSGNIESQPGIDTYHWLVYIHESLTARRTYMKRQQLRKRYALKYMQENLSADEIERINQLADEQSFEAPARRSLETPLETTNDNNNDQLTINTAEQDEAWDERS